MASILKKVWVSEKATDLAKSNRYSFVVDSKANKPNVKKAVEQLYSVKVVDVNIINAKPKSRRLGRSLGRKPGFKKAIVTLAEGQTIDVMPH